MRDERGQRPQVKHTFRRWIKTMADDRDQPRMMMANTFYNYFHFHLNPVIPCVDWLTLPSTTYTQRTTRFVQKGKRQNSKKKNRLRQEIMSRQVALGQSQNNRRLQGECQTEDCARQCFQDDWQAPTVFSRLCFREPEAGARKARIFLSWHPTKRQVDGGRDECTSSPVVRRRKPKREDGGGGEVGGRELASAMTSMAWRRLPSPLRLLSIGYVRHSLPPWLFSSIRSHRYYKTQSTIYSGKSLEKE